MVLIANTFETLDVDVEQLNEKEQEEKVGEVRVEVSTLRGVSLDGSITLFEKDDGSIGGGGDVGGEEGEGGGGKYDFLHINKHFYLFLCDEICCYFHAACPAAAVWRSGC